MQNEPNLGRPGWDGAWERGAILRNEANFSIADCGLGTDLRRDAYPSACAGRLYKQTQLTGANRAKRTQFGPASAGPGPRWTKDAKRTQFPAAPGGTGPQGRGTEANRAKQTQFRPVEPDPKGRLCETNPNLGRMGHPGDGMPGRGRIMQNESNPGGARWDYSLGGEGRIMQNEPNFGELAGGWNTQHSTILSFHHFSPMPIVRSEANSRRGRDGRSRNSFCPGQPGAS